MVCSVSAKPLSETFQYDNWTRDAQRIQPAIDYANKCMEDDNKLGYLSAASSLESAKKIYDRHRDSFENLARNVSRTDRALSSQAAAKSDELDAMSKRLEAKIRDLRSYAATLSK